MEDKPSKDQVLEVFFFVTALSFVKILLGERQQNPCQVMKMSLLSSVHICRNKQLRNTSVLFAGG